MQPFEIEKTSDVLILRRRPQPVIDEAIRIGIIVVGACLAAWFGIVDIGSRFSLFTFCLAVLMALFYEARRIRQVIQGDVWRFDRVERLIHHNDAKKASLDDIQSVCLSEDCGSDNIEHRIALVPKRGKLVFIRGEGSVFLDELRETAEQIAEFLNVPLVHERR